MMQPPAELVSEESLDAPVVSPVSGSFDLVNIVHLPEWKTLLIDLVKSNQMDPWSIDIIDLTEKYIQKVKELEGLNLRVPANCMLACAILLHLKSKKMVILPFEEEEELVNESSSSGTQERLFDDFIPELKNPRMMREGRVSLDELVSAIEDLLDNQKKYGNRFGKRLGGGDIAFQIPFSDTDMQERQEKVYTKLLKHKDSTGLCLFSHITKELTPVEKIFHFVPLLFLANKGKVTAWQEEFWGEIFIAVNEVEKTPELV